MTLEERQYAIDLLAAKYLGGFRELLNPDLAEILAGIAVDTLEEVEEYSGKLE